MMPVAVFLHTVLIISAGPLLAGLLRLCSSGGGWQAFMGPVRSISAGLRASGQPPLGHLAAVALAIVTGLLLPLFSSDAVLGFLGDGFTALLLLTGLSTRYLPIRASSVLAVAAALWALGTLTGSTDLAQALAFWQPGPASWLIFLGFALGVAPMLRQVEATGPGLDAALEAWTRSTLQLGWLALGAMAFPITIPLTGWAAFAGTLALFGIKFVVLGGLAAFVSTRWPRLPLSELGLACSLLALALVKLGV